MKDYFEIDRKRQLEKHKETKEDFKQHCISLGIELADEAFDCYYKIGVVAKQANILKCLNQDIHADKDGLVSFTRLREMYRLHPMCVGYFFSDKYMAMASPLFRRSLSRHNHWSPVLLDILFSIDEPSLEVSIALDYDCARINIDEYGYFERDVWYGATYNGDITKIKDGYAKLRPPLDIDMSDISFFFENVYALDLNWVTKGDIKTIQVVEFKQDDFIIEKNGQMVFPARYFHAEFDMESKTFRHLDGAIHYYSEEEYYNRRDSNFSFSLKGEEKDKALSEKLFKVNGTIDVGLWEKICSYFFYGNPLVHEYFEGELPSYLIEKLDQIRSLRE